MLLVPWFLLTAQPILASSGHPKTEALADIFIEACIKGEVRFTSDVATKRLRSELGAWHRRDMKEDPDALFFEIRKPAWALLMIAKTVKPTRDGWIEQCAVETEGHNLDAAWKKIAAAVSGNSEPVQTRRDADSYTIDFPARRYRVQVSDYLMSTTIYDEKTAAKMLAQQPKSERGRARVRAQDTIFD